MHLMTHAEHLPSFRPRCTVSWRLQNPTWWRLWCQSGPGRTSVQSSCWAGPGRPCEASLHCGWSSPVWAWWSLGCLCLPGKQIWHCRERRGPRWTQPSWHWRTSWDLHSWCSPPSCRALWRHRRSSHLQKIQIILLAYTNTQVSY